MRKYFLIPSLLLSGLALLLLGGCTRPEGENSKVTLTLPMISKQSLFSKSGAQSKVATLSNNSFYLALNITGAGNQIVCTYESRDQVSSGPCVFSFPNVTIEIQQGAGILFQVMLAEDGEESMDLLYGEKTDEVKGSASTVKLDVASILTSGSSGHVEGRYIGGTSVAPTFKTGKMNIKFAPPTGSKPMTVLESEMFAGWFRGGRALEGVKFIYEVEGEQLFPTLTTGLGFAAFDNIVSTIVANSTNEVLKVLEDGETNFFYFGGFFGPGVNASTYAALASGCSVNLYSTCLEVSNINGVTPFRGPFKPYATSSSKYLHLNGSNWEFQTLPGVNDSVIDGVKVYKLSNLANPQVDLKPYALDDGRWNCERIKKDGVLLTTVDQANAKTFPEPVGLSSSNAVFLCPFKGDRLFTSAVGYPDFVNQFSNRGYQGDYLHLNYLAVMNEGNQRNLIPNHCYQASVGLYEGHGNQKIAQADVLVNFDVSQAPGLTYFTDNSCSSPLATDLDANSQMDIVISGGMSSADIFVMMTTEATREQRYSSATIPGVPFQLVTQKGRLEMSGPAKAHINECFAVELLQKNALGQPVPFLQTTLINIDGEGLEFYENSDPYCAGTSLTQIEIVEQFSSNYRFFVKKTAGGTKSLTVTNTSAGNGNFLIVPLSIGDRTGTTVAQNLKLEVSGPNPLLFSGCYPAKAFLVNSAGESVPAFHQSMYPIKTTHGNFYFDNSCTGTPIEAVYLMAGQSQQNLYFRADAKGISNGSSPVPVASPLVSVPFISPAIVISPPVENPANSTLYLRFASVPQFQSRIIGAHEFGSSRSVVLDAPVGTQLSCSETGPPTFMTWTPCSDFDTATKTLTWTSAKAIAGNAYLFTAKRNGLMVDLKFSPAQYYADQTMMNSDKFLVVHCDTTVTMAESPLSGTDLNTYLDSGSVCLNQGVVVDPDLTQINLHNTGVVNRSLIGWAGTLADGSQRNLIQTQTDAGATIYASIDAVPLTDQPVVLANLIVTAAPSAPAINFASSTASGLLHMRWANLKLKSWTGTESVVRIAGNSQFASLLAEDLTFDLGNSWTAVTVTDNGSSTMPTDTEFRRTRVINSANDGTLIRGIKAIASSGAAMPTNVKITDYKMLVPGVPLEILGTSGPVTVLLENAEFDAGVSMTPTSMIQINGIAAHLTIMNSKLTTGVNGGPLISLLSSITSLKLRQNILTRTANGDFINLAIGAISNFDLVGNSFRSAGVASSNVLVTAGGVDFGDSLAAYTPAAGFHYYNRVCHTGGTAPGLITNGLMTQGVLPNSVSATPLTTGACP